MRLTYCQCVPAAQEVGDCLASSEPIVLDACAPLTRIVVADPRLDPRECEELNRCLTDLAFDWASVDGDDPTVVNGISIADLAGTEALQGVLLPAARGVLGMQSALAQIEGSISELRTVVAGDPGSRYRRAETVEADSASTASSQSALGREIPLRRSTSADSRNELLVAKYRRSRDTEYLPARHVWWRVRASLLAVGFSAGLRRRRPTLAVLQYHPTAAFARQYLSFDKARHRLLRLYFGRDDLGAMLCRGDMGVTVTRSRSSDAVSSIEQALTRFFADSRAALSQRFTISGVDVSPVVLPYLRDLVLQYASLAGTEAPRLRRTLRRSRTQAVLVPFETSTVARLLIRAAEQEAIPVVSISDGFRGDDHTRDSTLASVACAVSESSAQLYVRPRMARKPVFVTGDPRTDQPARELRSSRRWPPKRILVGSYVFDPGDVNCNRADPERFLDAVLDGIAAGVASDWGLMVNLHPADSGTNYDDIVAKYSDLAVEVRATGDVVDMFADADVYITTHSTSLLQAAASRLPIVYYRVNDQVLHPPFSDDPVIARCTAATRSELADIMTAASPPAIPSENTRQSMARTLRRSSRWPLHRSCTQCDLARHRVDQAKVVT